MSGHTGYTYYNFQEIATYILGVDREELELLRNLLNVRQQALNEEDAYLKAHSLYVGDHVKMHANLNPKKLSGVECRITEILPGNKYRVEPMKFLGDNWRHFTVEAHHFDKV